MEKLILIIVLVSSIRLFAQTEVDLSGKVFIGTAVEIVPPDVDRMPMQYNEKVRIIDGKVMSDVMDVYSAEECSYTAITDDRRMIAIEITDLNFKTKGSLDGKDVAIEFTGIVAARSQLSGELVISYPDGNEVKFEVTAKSE